MIDWWDDDRSGECARKVEEQNETGGSSSSLGARVARPLEIGEWTAGVAVEHHC